MFFYPFQIHDYEHSYVRNVENIIMTNVREYFIKWLSNTILRYSPPVEKQQFRNLEKLTLKYITLGELLPVYTHIYIYMYI